MGESEIRNPLTAYLREEQLVTLIKSTCKKRPAIFGCINDFTQAINNYLSPEDYLLSTLIHNVIINLVDYVCKDDGVRVIELRKSQDEICYKSMEEDINKCFIKNEDQWNEEMTTPYSFNDCYKPFKSMKMCVIENMSTCSKIISGTLDDVMEFVLQQIKSFDEEKCITLLPLVNQ